MLDGKTIGTSQDGERTLLVSVIDPNRDEPGRRLLADGSVELLPGTPQGLTVFGRSVHDRPHLSDLGRLMPVSGYLAAGVAAGRGLAVDG